jgi:ABC-type branched-subunit amino acid transport system ATPase component
MNPMGNGPLLEGRELTKFFGGLAAVSEVSFHLQSGEILGLIGPNGAGKTTLFNIIAGVYKPSHGEVLFHGQDITPLGPNEVCKLGIARTFQTTALFDQLRVVDNLAIGCRLRTTGRSVSHTDSVVVIWTSRSFDEPSDTAATSVSGPGSKPSSKAACCSLKLKPVLIEPLLPPRMNAVSSCNCRPYGVDSMGRFTGTLGRRP